MITYLYLGRVAYDDGLRLQEQLVELRRADRIGNVLLLLEHPPVLTLGRHANRANVLASDEMLASRGVTVNAIAPGFVETEMTEAVRNKAGDLIKKMIPMKRLGKPEDIARVAVFLASPDAGYITGQVITVDGGLSLGAVAV